MSGPCPRTDSDAEYLDLIDEITHQSFILDSFDHVAVTYEDLLRGPLEKRLSAFGCLLDQVDSDLADAFATPHGRKAVAQALAPARQTRLLDETKSTAVRLVDQVPLFCGIVPLLSPDEVAGLRTLVDAQRARSTTLYGVDSCDMNDILADSMLQDLTDRVNAALAAVNGPRIEGWPITLRGMCYDPATAPDHDLVLSDPPLDTRDHSLQFSVSLGHGERNRGVCGGGAIHLAGRGPQEASRTIGSFFYFASGIGARREPVQDGRLCSIVGSFALAPNQILAAGHVFGDTGMFQHADEDSATS